jgi:carboxymethylenebutenolidase
MADIQIPTLQGDIDAALDAPVGDGPWPGVVVVHDLLGLSADIRNITRRFADNGYLAIAPDLYSRGGRARCVRSVMRDLFAGRGGAVEDIIAVRDTLVGRPDCTGMVGVAGRPRGSVHPHRSIPRSCRDTTRWSRVHVPSSPASAGVTC